MSAPSGADMAAGPSRLERRGGHPLAMARPLVLIIALWQFLERGRYPEVVVSCMFQIWRTLVKRGQWPRGATEISGQDVEAQAPSILNSRTSAASFACIEQLGVKPPPAAGWVPRDTGEEEDREDGSQEGRAEWWSNIRDAEWIYHSTEDKYFHVPSNSLWERRETECCDPCASPHTYARVDALHLQALSHFATSMDTALVPMAWKAWVRYTRRKTGRGRAFRQPPPEPCEAGPGEDVPEDNAKEDWRTPPGAGDPPACGAADRGQVRVEVASPREQGCPDAAAGKGSNVSTAPTTEAEILDAAAANIAQLAAGHKAPSLVKAPSLTGQTSTADSSELTKALLSAEEKSSPAGGRKGWCLCFRVRVRSSRKEERGGGGEATPKTASAEAASKGAYTSGSVHAARDCHPSAVSGRDEEPIAPSPPRKAPTHGDGGVPDRHTQRFEQFLAEVKRNPQRLITHVERRRAEKSAAAFLVL